jgi:hypothetical protein
MSPDEVHFHEVGAVDSIVDVVGTCTLMEALAPDHVVASPVNVGSGTVMCAHGEFPVPAPATLKLLEGIPVYAKGEPFERTTPTGAALLKVFAESYGLIPAGIVERTGYGLGDRESELPNLLQGICSKATVLRGKMPDNCTMSIPTITIMIIYTNIHMIITTPTNTMSMKRGKRSIRGKKTAFPVLYGANNRQG